MFLLKKKSKPCLRKILKKSDFKKSKKGKKRVMSFRHNLFCLICQSAAVSVTILSSAETSLSVVPLDIVESTSIAQSPNTTSPVKKAIKKFFRF